MRIILGILIVIIILLLVVSEIFFKNILKAPFVNPDKDTGAREFDATLTKVSITSKDGLTLYAGYRFHEEETHRYVISVHGYKDNHRFMLPCGKAFYEKGYHVLLPDDRGHGESEGRFIGMGWLDKEDVKLWIKWILEQDAKAQIIVHGISMGAATTMMVAGDDPKAVDGYIEDCGYTSVWDIFKTVMNRDYHLPAFPILYICDLYCRLRAGYGFKQASALTQLKKATKPMLFIHGEKDTFIPVAMCHTNYAAYPAKKDLFLSKEADHAMSMIVDEKAYYEKIFSFIESEIGWK